MFNIHAVLTALMAATLIQAPRDRSPLPTTSDEFKSFIEMITASQPELEDFTCEYEGSTVIRSEPVKLRLKLPDDGIARRFSGVFVWTARGDISVNTLHRIEPAGSIQREQLVVRAAKNEAEHYLRDNNSPIGRATIDRPSQIDASQPGSLGSILLIDSLKRYSVSVNKVFSIGDDVLDGQKVMLVSISFDNSSTPYQKVWIDLHRGGNVVRWDSFAPSGELTGRANIKLGSYPLADRTVWIPTSGIVESHNAFKDGKPYYPSEPTSIDAVYIVNGTLMFNKHPGLETFKITYKLGTPISDNLRKLEYEFGQQKVEKPPRGPTRAEAEKMLNEALAKAEEQKSELVIASTPTGFDWASSLPWVFGVFVVISSIALLIQRRIR
jgi:hypothetical protein